MIGSIQIFVKTQPRFLNIDLKLIFFNVIKKIGCVEKNFGGACL